jgi:hypothetical protein
LVELTRGLRLDWFDKVGIGDDMSDAAGVDDITLSWDRNALIERHITFLKING